MSASSIVRGARSALPPREALILFALINHPWLLENHAEELAELEFHHPDADRLRRAILEAVADHEAVDTHALRAAIDKREARHAAGAGRKRRSATAPTGRPARMPRRRMLDPGGPTS